MIKRKKFLPTLTEISDKDKWVTEFIERNINWNDIPRFLTKGMNQAEFVRHLLSVGFFSGLKYAHDNWRKNEKDKIKN